MARLRIPTWMDDALCAQVDPELFFPEAGQSAEPAMRICAECPARAECLAYLDTLPRGLAAYGVWGGVNASRRRGAA